MKGKKMRLNVLGILMVIGLLLSSCQSGTDPKLVQKEETNAHVVEVKEVIQTSGYTYLSVNEGKEDYWIAVTRMDAEEGDIYYFLDGLVMKNFESKELDRTFEEVVFVQEISGKPIAAPQQVPTEDVRMERPENEQKEISVEVAEGGISIAELFANRDSYSEKSVKIRGEVVKFNPDIMGTNWIHIQDGTSDDGNFDLTITSPEKVEVGDVVTFVGTITLNKDFGAGYVYEVIMESAMQPDLEY